MMLGAKSCVRNAEAFFVGCPLVGASMLAQGEAIVAGEDQQRIVQLPAVLQDLIDAPHALVDRRDAAEVGADELVVFLLAVERPAQPVPSGVGLLQPLGLSVGGMVIVGIGRPHDLFRVEGVFKLRLGNNRAAVRRLVADHEKPRLLMWTAASVMTLV
jgi:hypothetical protein